MIFTMKWGLYIYNVMPFKLVNTHIFFSTLVVVAFHEYIHKFLEIYLDDSIMYIFLKDRLAKFRLMTEICKQM